MRNLALAENLQAPSGSRLLLACALRLMVDTAIVQGNCETEGRQGMDNSKDRIHVWSWALAYCACGEVPSPFPSPLMHPYWPSMDCNFAGKQSLPSVCVLYHLSTSAIQFLSIAPRQSVSMHKKFQDSVSTTMTAETGG